MDFSKKKKKKNQCNPNVHFFYFAGLTTLDVDHTIHLGGLETLDSFYPDPENDDPNFMGCMRNLYLNGKAYPLTKVSSEIYSASNINRPFLKFKFYFVIFQDSGWKGLSIDDCDGTGESFL